MIRASVVVPCRNEGGRLTACLDALEAQDFPRAEFEILVVDGSSILQRVDGSQRPNVRLLADQGKGPAAARNIGIDAARGPLVAFTDADCLPRFDWLQRLVDAADADPQAQGFAGALRLPRETQRGRMEDNDARVHYAGFITSNIAYRRDILREVGGFNEALSCAEDYDLAWRILEAGHRIERVPEAIVLHDPPEVAAGLHVYLRKQFWYARCDVPAHALAVGRAWRAHGLASGPRAIELGLSDAVKNAGITSALVAGVLGRSPLLAGAGLAAVMASATRRVARTVATVGEGTDEVWSMALVETSKRIARGAGTLVGIADLARRPLAGFKTARRAPSAAGALAPPLRA